MMSKGKVNEMTYEEALKEYNELYGIPLFDEFVELYRLYRTTLKKYKWASFIECVEWFK